MAKYVAIRTYVNLHAHRNFSEERSLVPGTLYAGTPRKSYLKNSKLNQFSPRSAHKLITPHLRTLKVTPRQDTFLWCRCQSLSALVDPDALTASDWVPVIDQVFLLLSIMFTHMAGVTSAEKSFYHTQTRISGDNAVPENSSHPGSSPVNDTDVNLKFAWGIVKDKLKDSLSYTKDGVKVSDNVTELEKGHVKNPSSLSAVAEGPRFRLLLASFEWLQNEVVNISGNYATEQRSDFLVVLSEIIQKCWQPLSIAWMEEELCLVTSKPDKALLSFVVKKLNARDSLMRNIRKSGKEDLYAELIFALRFGLVRTDGFYNHSLFIQHGVAILEDLVIMVADGIASMYLELISVDSSLSIEMNNLGLSLCSLSTRALQRLRNEVALHQWLHQNMEAVVSMYEDRFDLLTLQRQSIEESSRSKDEKLSWWKRFVLRSGSVSSSLHLVVISHISVPVKRTKELRDLTGWRYYYSLFLELADITSPIIKTVIAKVSDAISFFLVCLIGRSLGLIYSGIRQSLRWK